METIIEGRRGGKKKEGEWRKVYSSIKAIYKHLGLTLLLPVETGGMN